MLFPFAHPRMGISLSNQRVTLVEARQGRSGASVRQIASQLLPEALFRPSVTERNVADVPALAQELGRLVGGLHGRPTALPVTFSLPDLCARFALLPFESWPKRAAEREELLRWRLQKELNLHLADMRVAFRTFPVSRPVSRGHAAQPDGDDHPSKKVVRIFAAAVRRDTLAQVEEACQMANLIPVSVGLASPMMFDLYRPVMTKAVPPPSEQGPDQSAVLFFLSLSEGSFTFWACQDGSPTFLRSKPVRNGTGIPHEVLATLQFYDERNPVGSPGFEGSLRPMFVIHDGVIESADEADRPETTK
ncbi:MAG: hypothetical protein ACREI3_03415, partial [Nitrospirales bacterium]